jgi:hypothetical protein
LISRTTLFKKVIGAAFETARVERGAPELEAEAAALFAAE